MGEAGSNSYSFQHFVYTVDNEVHGIFPAYREKTILFPINVHLEMLFTNKLEGLFFEVGVQLFNDNQVFDPFQEVKGSLFGERMDSPYPEKGKYVFKTPDSFLCIKGRNSRSHDPDFSLPCNRIVGQGGKTLGKLHLQPFKPGMPLSRQPRENCPAPVSCEAFEIPCHGFYLSGFHSGFHSG